MQVHGGLVGLANAGAIDAVLADEDQRIGEEIGSHGEFPASVPHLEFIPFELLVIHMFLSILEE